MHAWSVSTVPALPSITVSSSTGNTIILNNTAITVNCEVDFGQGVSESELSLLMVEAQLFRDGTPLMLDDPTMSGSSLVFGSEISSFNDSSVGNYSCTATISPASSSRFLTGTGQGTSPLVRLTVGKQSSYKNTIQINNNDFPLKVSFT